MTDLEKRKLMAEFAGWENLVVVEGRPDYLRGEDPEDFIVSTPPDYESDPAAACSLLPKIARATVSLYDNGGDLGRPYWCTELVVLMKLLRDELWSGNDAAVCRFIFEAVKKIQEAKP